MRLEAGGWRLEAETEQNAAEESFLSPRFNIASRFLLPASCLLLALILRLPGLTWGLPNAEHWYSYHPDERQIAQAVYNVLMSRDWNPQFFNYPSLFIYLTYFSYSIQTLLGMTTPAQGQSPWPFLHDVMLCGRIVSALLGAFTVPAVYLMGRQLASEKLALFAAFLMAVAPGHIQHSHFATVDVPATFFVTWALYFAAQSLKENQTKPIFISAFLCGLAAATKYNAGLVLLAPLLVSIQNSGHPLGGFKIQNCLMVLGAVIFGFVLACPHSVLNTAQFLGNRTDSGVLYELLVHSRQGHGDVFVHTGNGWLYHLTFNLPFAVTAPGAFCAVIGLVLAIRSKNKLWMPLLAFAGVYFFTLGLSQVRFMRYLFPLLPVLCLAVPLCFQLMPKAAQKISVPAFALLMFIGATNVLYPFCVPDPRDQAAAYLKSKVNEPVTIALINQPWFYTPPLWPQDYPPPQKVQRGISPDGRFRFVTVGFDTHKILQTRAPWFVSCEFEWREKRRLGDKDFQMFYDISGIMSVAARQVFQNRVLLELPGRTFKPHDFIYTNPEVWIYEDSSF